MRAVNLIPSDAQRAGGALSAEAGVRHLRALRPAHCRRRARGGCTSWPATRWPASRPSSRRCRPSSPRSGARPPAGQLRQFARWPRRALQTVRGIAAHPLRLERRAGEPGPGRPRQHLASIAHRHRRARRDRCRRRRCGRRWSSLRADLPGPAFELSGCTASQDDVARLITRLRVMPGRHPRRAEQLAEEPAAPARAPLEQRQAARPGAPSFNLVVFYQTVSGAGATGATSLGATATIASRRCASDRA